MDLHYAPFLSGRPIYSGPNQRLQAFFLPMGPVSEMREPQVKCFVHHDAGFPLHHSRHIAR